VILQSQSFFNTLADLSTPAKRGAGKLEAPRAENEPDN
jgi:hypothetical protein